MHEIVCLLIGIGTKMRGGYPVFPIFQIPNWYLIPNLGGGIDIWYFLENSSWVTLGQYYKLVPPPLCVYMCGKFPRSFYTRRRKTEMLIFTSLVPGALQTRIICWHKILYQLSDLFCDKNSKFVLETGRWRVQLPFYWNIVPYFAPKIAKTNAAFYSWNMPCIY